MIPLATTTVSIIGRRPQSAFDPEADGYDTPQPPMVVLITGVRACISRPLNARGGTASSDRSDAQDSYALRMDLVDVGLTQYDIIIDESDDARYLVSRALPSKPTAFGLEHITADIKRERGISGAS